MKAKKQPKEKYLISPCCKAGLRADVNQSVDVEITANGKFAGYIEIGCDFSDPEVNEEYVYCESCGEKVNYQKLLK